MEVGSVRCTAPDMDRVYKGNSITVNWSIDHIHLPTNV